jgi:Ca-activated chloride channel homolog
MRAWLGTLLFLLSTLLAAAQVKPGAVLPPDPGRVAIDPGEKLIIELETSLHTRTTRKGDKIRFHTLREVRAGNQVVIPRGSIVQGLVTVSRRAGRIAGRSEIQLRLEDIRFPDGTILKLPASIVRVGVSQVEQAKNSDPKVRGESGAGGGTAAILTGGMQGAVIGVLGGGARGAMYGGAIGAGVGVAQILLRRGPDVDLPRNTIFEARFDQRMEIPGDTAKRMADLGARTTAPSSAELRIPEEEPVPEPRKADRPALTRRRAEPEPAPETAKIEPLPAPVPAPPPVPQPPPGADASPDPGSFKLSVSVQLVQVDAFVRDRAGKPMDKLSRDDFRLFEEGAEQEILSLSRDELPIAVALVIDRSGSVAPYMNEIRHAAYRALMQLKPGDKVCLFSFAAEVDRLEDLTSDRQRIADRIAMIRGGGGTNIVDAVHDAANYLAMVAPESRRAVILISDNQETTHPRATVSNTVKLAIESETVIYSVKTSGEGLPITMRIPNLIAGSSPVPRLTEESGGEIIEVAKTGSLDEALRSAVERLKLRYTLGYSPVNPQPGTFRKIEVRLTDQFGKPSTDYRVHCRTGYYYPAPRTTSKTAP